MKEILKDVVGEFISFPKFLERFYQSDKINLTKFTCCPVDTSSPVHCQYFCLVFPVRQRDEWEKRRKTKVKRERGWTGHSWGGISLGPPDPGPNGGKHTADCW